MTKKKKIKQTPRPRTELADQLRFWDYFDKDLYFRVCEIKSKIR